MTSIKGHFDGRAIVLDEPATLAVGQTVRVIVEPLTEVGSNAVRNGGAEDDVTGDTANDLIAAATSSTDFWDNALDDEDWNDR